MSRKARKQILRERDRQHRLREEQALEDKAKELQSRVAGFSHRSITDEIRREIKRANTLGVLQRAATNRGELEVTRPQVQGGIKYRSKPKYSGEMAEREAAALAQYEVMKSHTAPIGNKMGYQYIPPDSLDAADVRAGNTKRR